MKKNIINQLKSQFLKAVEINPKDDSHHNNINLLEIEWWYFDAIFENGYSVHIGFRAYHIRKIGLVQSRINIYKDGKEISKKLKIDFFSKFFVDKNFPTIKINNKIVVNFDNNAYRNNNEWIYKIKLSIKNDEVDLLFKGLTKGWKIETSDTSWAVSLPKAIVTGEIKINNKKIQCKGIGYHDHNWGYSPVTAINNLGWYWGRAGSETMNITWAKTIQDKSDINIIAVLNKDNDTFFNINPENIEISTESYKIENRKKIPKIINLKINDITTDNLNISCKVKMETMDVQYTRIFTIKYWRYHVLTSGEISIGTYFENFINKPQIIELLKFKDKEIE